MKVGAERDWSLDLYAATSPSGEAGIYLRFTWQGSGARGQGSGENIDTDPRPLTPDPCRFTVFLGRPEQKELARLLHWQKDDKK